MSEVIKCPECGLLLTGEIFRMGRSGAKRKSGVFKNVILTDKEREKGIDEGLPDDEGISSLLSLVCVDVEIEVVRYWTPEMKEEAVEWASCSHLYASDNLDVVVPDIPTFIKEIKDKGRWS